jgi:outer membrane murein-binding lipoprotein Lpp
MDTRFAKLKIKNKHSVLTNHRKTKTTCRVRYIAPFVDQFKIGAIHRTLLTLFLVAGCANPKEKEVLTAQIRQLTQENTQLQKQVEQCDSENKGLKDQIQALSELPENVRFENLNRLEKIKIGRYTGFFDKDDDGKKEKLIVYIHPTDEQGNALKAAGAVEVQLWDLNKTNGQAMLGQWKIEPDELKKLWLETLVSIYYRLTFDVADVVENLKEPPTVKVTFTDYLTGKVFKEQKAIKAP